MTQNITNAQGFMPIPVPRVGTPISHEALLAQKLAATTLGAPCAAHVDWKNNRIHTPGDLVVVKDEFKNKAIIGRTCASAATVFTSPQGPSQGLIYSEGRTNAGSVTTAIKNPIPRKQQTYPTFIQFDKYEIDNRGADFTVPATKKNKNETFYSGCHLIDYQFITGTAHTDKNNYFPGNYFYNMSLRNWLVGTNRTAAYVEIPVYTPHPPMIETLRGQGTYAIPACVFFIRICPAINNEKQRLVIYCFPNNSYDYEDTKRYLELGPRAHFAEAMVPYFEFNPEFYHLLKPAIIHTLRQKQLEKEEGMAELIHDLMGFDECEKDICKLGQQVMQAEVNPTLLLPNCGRVLDVRLEEAMQFAGDFLIRHALRNALKAETYSLTARLSFINAIVTFIEQVEIASNEEKEFMQSFAKDLENTLSEIRPLIPNLDVDQLLDVSATYFNISSRFTLPYAWQDGTLLSADEFNEYYKEGIDVLRLLVEQDPKTFTREQIYSFLWRLDEAEDTFNLLSQLGLGDEFSDEDLFLEECSYLKIELAALLMD